MGLTFTENLKLVYQTIVALENMEFYAFHGYYPEERKMGNDYLLSISCSIGRHSGDAEDIKNTVNYESLYAICKEVMQTPHQLLESITKEILQKVSSRYSQVESATVILKKAQPQLGGRVEWSSVEMKF